MSNGYSDVVQPTGEKVYCLNGNADSRGCEASHLQSILLRYTSIEFWRNSNWHAIPIGYMNAQPCGHFTPSLAELCCVKRTNHWWECQQKHSRSVSLKTRYLTTYSRVVNFLLKNLRTMSSSQKIESWKTHFTQLAYMTLSQYFEELVAETLRCEDVYKWYALNDFLSRAWTLRSVIEWVSTSEARKKQTYKISHLLLPLLLGCRDVTWHPNRWACQQLDRGHNKKNRRLPINKA